MGIKIGSWSYSVNKKLITSLIKRGDRQMKAKVFYASDNRELEQEMNQFFNKTRIQKVVSVTQSVTARESYDNDDMVVTIIYE